MELPTLKIELDGIKTTLLYCLNSKHSDLMKCVEKGINAAMTEIPQIISIKCDSAIKDAIDRATASVLDEYFDYGGEGYVQIKNKIREMLNINS